MIRILFFDDEPSISGYLVQNLRENYGWKGDKKITFVSTVEDLYKEVNDVTVSYNLFVLDVMAPMPLGDVKNQFSQSELNKMDKGRLLGYVMAEKIRKMEKYMNVPVLYLTARIIPPIPETKKGYTAYNRKPVSAEEISKTMNELLESSNQ